MHRTGKRPPEEIGCGMHLLRLTKGYVALISSCDAERVGAYSWSVIETKPGRLYAQARINNRAEYLHRFVMQAPSGSLVDHVSGDGLDCTRENMRLADHSENGANRRSRATRRDRFKGVVFHAKTGKFRAEIKCRGVRRHLGLFATEEAAAAAYDSAARDLFGEFAKPNFGGST
jgi:hypothetical protein